MNILVTGVSRGVGLAVCRVLLEQGHTVYGVSRSYSEEFRFLESANSGRLFFKSFDLSKPDEIHQSVFKDFVKNEIVLHGLVNNAAIAYDDIVTNLNLDKLNVMYQTNVFSSMILTKYAIRNMLFNKTKGGIIFISSISAHTGYKGLSMYASGKAALEAFSKNVGREWGELGIRSNTVVPGFMETEMSSSLSDDQKSRIYNRTSLKKATSVDAVAETVAFLLSDKAESITGQNIHVDSGTI